MAIIVSVAIVITICCIRTSIQYRKALVPQWAQTIVESITYLLDLTCLRVYVQTTQKLTVNLIATAARFVAVIPNCVIGKMSLRERVGPFYGRGT